MFSDRQNKLLADVLDKNAVKTRAGADGRVSYLDGFTVLAAANEIFGAGNLDFETIELREIHPPVMFTPPPTRDKPNPKAQVVASYACKVRVTIWNEARDKKCVREAWNAHRAFAMTVGEAVEVAITSSETQALKRALRSLGFPLGLALYEKEQRHVGTPGAARPSRQIEQDRDRPMAPIDEGFEQPERPTNSQRALAASRAPPASANGVANGHDKSRLPY